MTTDHSDERLDLSEVLHLLDELRERIEGIDGSLVNVEVRSKAVNARKAEINRSLLYIAHLADLTRAEVMSHYHRFKGEDPPWLEVR